MTIDEAIKAKLDVDASLSAPNIYPVRMKQNTNYPAITYQRISGERELSHNGPDGLVKARFQIDIFDKTFSGVRAAFKEVRESLSGFRGISGDFEILNTELDNETDTYEADTNLYRVQSDFIFLHCE